MTDTRVADTARLFYRFFSGARNDPDWDAASIPTRMGYEAAALAVVRALDAHRSPQCVLRGRCPETAPPATDRAPLLNPAEHAKARAIRSHHQEDT